MQTASLNDQRTIQATPRQQPTQPLSPANQRRNTKIKALLPAVAFALSASLCSNALASDNHYFSPSKLAPQTGSEWSAHSGKQVVYADVIDVHPLVREVRVQEPRRECWTEYQRHQTNYKGQALGVGGRDRSHGHANSRGSGASPLLGTIVGGAIGNKIGRHLGSGEVRLGATIAGALIGTALANDSGGRQWRERRNNHSFASSDHRRDRFRTERRKPSRKSDRRHRPQHPMRPIERCTTRTVTTTEERIAGYRVTYRYHGQTFQTRIRNHPGDRLRLEVQVKPLP